MRLCLKPRLPGSLAFRSVSMAATNIAGIACLNCWTGNDSESIISVMHELHPTIVKDNGKPVYVVLPYAEFEDIQHRLELLDASQDDEDAKWDATSEKYADRVAKLEALINSEIDEGESTDMAAGFEARQRMIALNA